jgi:hypothetical protein
MLASEQLIEKESPPLIDKVEAVNESIRSASVFASILTLFLMVMRVVVEMMRVVPCGCENFINCQELEVCERLDLKKGNRVWVLFYQALSISLTLLFCPMIS